MNCDNIASKNFNYRKKNQIHWSRSVSASYYRIELSLRINYRKMSSMRCDCHPCYL